MIEDSYIYLPIDMLITNVIIYGKYDITILSEQVGLYLHLNQNCFD
jgi:hypothetical protein